MPRTPTTSPKPDIFRYHDYREYLRDLFAHRKGTVAGFSLRSLCREAKMASGYLPMVLAGDRPLSVAAIEKLAGPLGLTETERSYLLLLRSVADGESQQVRRDAFERLQRFRSYRRVNTQETEVYRYLSRWYYVVIREMAALAEFRPEPEWIRKKLRGKVPLKEIEQALTFLKEAGYLEALPDGKVRLVQRDLQCLGGVYRIALSRFHEEMLGQAREAIGNATAEERSITGHTFAIPDERYAEVKKILDEALAKIAALEQDLTPGTVTEGSVYHVLLSAFPLTQRQKILTEGKRNDPKELTGKTDRRDDDED